MNHHESTCQRRVLADQRKAENARTYEMIFPDPSDMMVAWIRFKVFNGVYKGQEHIVEFKFKYGSNEVKMYPLDPPLLTFKTPIFHPNINEFPGGAVCLDTIKQDGQWIPTCGIPGMIQILKALMICPNPDSPQNPKAGSRYEELSKKGAMETWENECKEYYESNVKKCEDIFEKFSSKKMEEFEENTKSKKRFEDSDSSDSSSESDPDDSDSSIEVPAPKPVSKPVSKKTSKKASKEPKKDKNTSKTSKTKSKSTKSSKSAKSKKIGK